ncbi:MAG: hypothetical protein HY016_00335 [Nitrosomonadales bacterium]|nr:hypothetical protein [Nitrosomonadales bacterium]
MSSESTHDQNTAATAGSGSHAIDRRAPDRRAGSTVERRTSSATPNNPPATEQRASSDRRTQQHPVQVAVFGGVRASDKSPQPANKVGVGSWVVWFAFISFAIAAWLVSRGGIIKPGIGLGYYFGLVGGILMLLMLFYPLRKHMTWARSWGPLRYWFMLHMVMGIGGPILVLFHSTFHVKSLNASVAFYSMLLVAGSGIIGRFIYKRIHHGLYGRKSELQELQQAVNASHNKMGQVSSILLQATGIGEKLEQFHMLAMSREGVFPLRAWRFMTLGLRQIYLSRNCRKELKRAIEHLAQTQGWDWPHQEMRFQAAVEDVNMYLNAVKDAAQFSVYERLFRLWHVLHSPFVWSLGVSGIVHVIATKFMY